MLGTWDDSMIAEESNQLIQSRLPYTPSFGMEPKVGYKGKKDEFFSLPFMKLMFCDVC